MGVRNLGDLPALVLCAMAVASCAAGDAAAGDTYRPPDHLERLGTTTFELPDAGLVQDFDAGSGRLYLLERFGRVLVLERRADGWAQVASFGRPGAGPGEFGNTTGIAAVDGAVVVTEWGRLQRFTSTGEFISAQVLTLPCAMPRPAAAAGRTGLFVHGNCLRTAYVTDTMKAVLAWAPDEETFRIIAEDVRFTRDGSTGSIFGAASALTTSADGRHLFGGGGHCLWHVDESIVAPGDVPVVEAQCPAATRLYSAPPPPALQRRLNAGLPGMKLEWPRALPTFVERIRAGDDVVLLRPFSADSVVLQTAGPDARDLAVAPLNGLVTCRAAGCLWVFEDGDVARGFLLDGAAVQSLVDGAGRR